MSWNSFNNQQQTPINSVVQVNLKNPAKNVDVLKIKCRKKNQ